MDLTGAIFQRRMTRSFSPSPIDDTVLDAVVAAALRAPSAGFSQGVDFLVLSGDDARRSFWECSSDEQWRRSGRQAAGILAAPVVVLPVADPDAYASRYGAPDKASSGLAGQPASAWPVPYWIVDASFAVMNMLLAATDSGLGALFFRLHRPADDVCASLGIPSGRVLIGAVALGHDAGERATASSSRRHRRPLDAVVHRDSW